MLKNLFFAFFALVLSINAYSQTIPDDDLIPICDSQSITTGAPGNTGIYNLTIPCNTGQPLSSYMDFYYVKILSGTTFTFVVTPIGNDDYDFGAWLNPNWDNINSTPNNRKRGSQNDPTQTGMYQLGLSMTATDLCETGGSTGYPEPGMVRYFDVQAEDEILIAIDRWSQTTQGYTIEFGGDAILDCTILGNSYGKCDTEEIGSVDFVAADFTPDLLEDFPNHNFKFYTEQLNAENGTGPQITFPYTVQYNNGEATEIYARVENQSGAFVRAVKLFLYVNLIPELINEVVELPLLCDENGDGTAIFDLTQVESEFVVNPNIYTFKYYTTEAFAHAGGNNNINTPGAYTSETATIYVRIETEELDGNEEGCYTVGQIELLVSDFYLESKTVDFNAYCDEEGNGNLTIDLTDHIDEITTSPDDYLITYHTSLIGAQDGTNPIPDPTEYDLNLGATTIFVRVQSLTDHCFSISRLNFYLNQAPQLLNEEVELPILCDENGDETATFDLTEAEESLLQNPNGYNFKYYTSEADAHAGGNNNIDLVTAYNSGSTSIYARIENNDLGEDDDECYSVAEIILIVSDFNVEEQNLDIDAICTEIGSNDHVVDLTENIEEFVDDANAYQITYHTTLEDAENDTNPIATPTNYTIGLGTTTIYVRIQSLTDHCFSISRLNYELRETPVLNALDDVNLCIDQADGDYIYDLTEFASEIIANPTAYEITYHTTQEDAENGENAIGNPAAYPITVNTLFNLYIRVEVAGCWNVGMVAIELLSNPTVVDLDTQKFCSNEQTGNIPYDLTQHEDEWTANPALFDFTYHTSQQDAENGQNAIGNPNAYSIPLGTTTTIYVRVENPNTGCYTITVLNLEPGATATLNQGLEIELCDSDFDGNYTYNLVQLNAQLVATTAGLTFAYYLNQQDALNEENPIAQSQWNNYSMNTMPYEIWVVATTVDQCASEPVKVQFVLGESINTLTDVIGPIKYCENEEINLTAYQSDMTQENVFFSYHHSLSDAENQLNPINNTTSFNPNGNNSVYVRLDATGRCSVIVEIQFEALPTPSIEINQTSIHLCPGDTFEAIAVSDDPTVSFTWYWNETEVGNSAELEIAELGIYTVIVTSADGCANEASIDVQIPFTPTITGVEMGPDYIIVSASSGGGGPLEYSLDQVFWQSTPKFSNLIPGEPYTIYVRESGCMIDSYDITLLFITNFVSPNGDGKNDTWEVRGIEVTPDATIKIFDRYGKVFVDTYFGGDYTWDGKYMGRSVAAGDYWYIMQVPGDGIIKDQKFVGHISVRNQ